MGVWVFLWVMVDGREERKSKKDKDSNKEEARKITRIDRNTKKVKVVGHAAVCSIYFFNM